MERKWMYGMNINDPEYVNGVQSFLIAAESDRVAKGNIEIFYLCLECKNFVPYDDIKMIEFHLLKYGFVRKYTCWSKHGESLVDNSTSSHVSNGHENNESYINDRHENLNEMLHDLEAIDAVLELLKLKASSSWSDTSFTKLLKEPDEIDDDVTKNGPPAKLLCVKMTIHQTISPCYSMSRSPPCPTMSCQTPISDLSSSLCYRPRMEENLIPFEHQMPSGGYMSLLETQGALLPQILTSWPQMVEQPMSSHPSTTEPAEPKQTQEDLIKERLDKVKYRPRSMQGSVKRFTNCKNQNISIVAPHEMYDRPWREWIEYEAILDLHIKGLVDITFIHWWTMKGYIVDLWEYKKKNENTYYFPVIVESDFDTKFDWTMVKGEWECGYYMMKFMYDLAINKQANFPQSVAGWLRLAWVGCRYTGSAAIAAGQLSLQRVGCLCSGLSNIGGVWISLFVTPR
ncbi:ulp1 protease family, C-terminal catalytic domain-containing protein [Tanacetum coccineum]